MTDCALLLSVADFLKSALFNYAPQLADIFVAAALNDVRMLTINDFMHGLFECADMTGTSVLAYRALISAILALLNKSAVTIGNRIAKIAGFGGKQVAFLAYFRVACAIIREISKIHTGMAFVDGLLCPAIAAAVGVAVRLLSDLCPAALAVNFMIIRLLYQINLGIFVITCTLRISGAFRIFGHCGGFTI